MSAPVGTHLIVGDFDVVAAMMAEARESGQLVRVLSAVELPDDCVEVVAEIREPERTRWSPWLRVLAWFAACGVAGAVIGLVVWAVMALVAAVLAVVAWVSAHLAAIVVGVVALVVLVWACSGSSCAGLHCGGCRR